MTAPAESAGSAYRDAGVDIDAGHEVVRRIKEDVASTRGPRVLGEVGGFGGFFAYPRPDSDHVLISSMDGVGTKLKLTAQLNRWEDAGYDIVSHCVNDILVHGAQPLFFLDYVGTGRLDPSVVARLVGGMAEACRESGCALLGGETAEMPGVYAEGDCDVVGCIVGEVSRGRILTGETIQPGDRILALTSIGLHTNGYSLARKILDSDAQPKVLSETVPGTGMTWGDALLRRHRMYLPLVAPLLAEPPEAGLRGFCHLTGGGLLDNLPRILPRGCRGVARRDAWEVPHLFAELVRRGGLDESEAFQVFNMGLGFLAVVAPERADAIAALVEAAGERPVDLGWIEEGPPSVRWAQASENGH